MTNAEAIESMRNLNALISITESEHESVRMAISALGKQVPKKISIYEIETICPACKNGLGYFKESGTLYCMYCGQKIEYVKDFRI